MRKYLLYADGKNVREWLFVEDCAGGILKILEKGKIGEVYNLGSHEEKHNIDVVKILLKILKKDKRLIEFVKDRPGHDIRYSLDSTKVFKEIKWQPNLDFNKGLESTLKWCLKYKDWLLSKRENILPLYNQR